MSLRPHQSGYRDPLAPITFDEAALETAACLALQREHNAKQTNLGACVILPIGHEAEHSLGAMRAEIARATAEGAR